MTPAGPVTEPAKRQCLDAVVSVLPTLDERNRAFDQLARNDLERIRLENERLAEEGRMKEVRLAEEGRMKEVRLAEAGRTKEARLAEEGRTKEARLAEEGRLQLLDPDQRTVYLRDALRSRDEYAGLLATVDGQTTHEAWSNTLRAVLGAPANVKTWRPKAEQKAALVDRLHRYAQQRLLQSVPSDVRDRHLLHWMALVTEDNVLELLRALQTPFVVMPAALPPPPPPPTPVVTTVAVVPIAPPPEFIHVTEASHRAQRNLADWPAPATQWLPQIRREGLLHAFQYLRLDAVGGPLDRLLVHAEDLQTVVQRGMVVRNTRGVAVPIRPRATCLVNGVGVAFELLFWSREHRDLLRGLTQSALVACIGPGSLTFPRGVLDVPALATAMQDALSLGRILARREPESVTERPTIGSRPHRCAGGYELRAWRGVWMVYAAADGPDEDRVRPMLPPGVFNVPRTATELLAAVDGWCAGPDTCHAWSAVLREPALVQMLLDAVHGDPDPFVQLMLRLNWNWLGQPTCVPPGIATTDELVAALRPWVPAAPPGTVVTALPDFTETVADDGTIVLHPLQTALDAGPHRRAGESVAHLL